MKYSKEVTARRTKNILNFDLNHGTNTPGIFLKRIAYMMLVFAISLRRYSKSIYKNLWSICF